MLANSSNKYSMISLFYNLIIMSGKRKLDRTGEDWDDATQTEGLTKRIKFTGEGEKIKLRPGTNEVVADPKRGIAWNTVIAMMVRNGVAKITDEDNVIVKTSEGLGAFDSLDEIIEEDAQNEIQCRDVNDPEEKKTFIELWVRERFTQLHGKISNASYNKVLEMLPDIAAGLMEDLHDTQKIQLSIAKRIVTILESLNRGDMDQKEYKALYDFFATLGEIKNVLTLQAMKHADNS